MATINANTKHTIKKKVSNVSTSSGKKGASKRGMAPPLVATLTASDVKHEQIFVEEIFLQVIGEASHVIDNSKPHTASTTRDRGTAAANLAVAAKELGVAKVLKEYGIMTKLQQNLFPQGIEAVLPPAATSGIRASASAVSLSSLDMGDDTTASYGTDSKRGKTTPPNCREGCLLLIRALCELLGKKAEPYVVGAFLAAALDECASNSSAVREAAEDTAKTIIQTANPWSVPTVVAPFLLRSLNASEWRIKAIALELLGACTGPATAQIKKMIPLLIPSITNQVWDTKPQVSKGAKAALLAVCDTNTNADVRPTIPAVVNAICKPTDTNKAVSELMGTTFVVPVDASTLAILCPILSRALKEKLAIHKRAACIVINNMSKLVETPSAVAPFGSLLVPELKKVATNVQFEEIRDEALKALASLTKALGNLYSETEDSKSANVVEEELTNVEAQQEEIKRARAEEEKKLKEQRLKEEEERRRFKEAMDAQRELDRLKAEEEKKKKAEEDKRKEAQKLSTKSATGKCQACGLKKCKKTCLFYKG